MFIFCCIEVSMNIQYSIEAKGLANQMSKRHSQNGKEPLR